MQQESLDKITKFGQEIITPEEGVIIIEPALELNAAQFMSIFDLIKGETSSPLEVGLVNLLPHLLVSLWMSFDENTKSSIRSKLYEKLSLNFHDKAVSKFADACIAVYKFSGSNWSELIEFIFHKEIVPLTGYLFVRLMSSVDGEFISTNIDNIVKKLVSLFPTSSISVQTGLIVILSIIDTAKALKENKELGNLLFTALIRIFTEEPDRIDFILPLIADIFESAPEVLNEKYEILSTTIANITSEKSAQPILHLIPYLCLEDLSSLLEKLYILAEKFLADKNELPKDLISSIDEAPLEAITDPAIENIIEFLKPKLDNPAGLALFAPFAAHIGEKFGEKELFNVVEGCIKESPIKIALGLAIFECISGYSEDLPFELPDDLMYKFLDLFGHQEEFVRNAAYSTISSLIVNNIFIHTDQTTALLKVYPNIKPEDLVLYFKQLRKLLRVEGLSDEVVESLFEFSMEHLKSSKDNNVLSQCLSVICAIASQEGGDDLVLGDIKTLLPIAVSLLKSDESSAFVYASRALVLFTSLNPSFCRRSVLALLPRIFQISTGEFETEPKVKGNIAIALASILVCLEVSKDFGRCIEIVDNFVQTNEVHLVTAASTMAEILRSSRDEKLNLTIFEILSKTAATTKDIESLNALLNALRKIIKNYKVEESNVLPLLRLFISGAHPIFERRPPSMFTDKSTKLYSYLTEVCDRYNNLIPEIAPSVIQWFTDAPLFMYGVMLQTVTYLVGVKAIQNEDAKTLMKVFISRMSGQKADVDEVILGNILMLLKQDSTLTDIQNLFEQLKDYWKDTKEDELSGWRAQVGSAILVMCSLGADADAELVEDILSDYPFDPEFGKCEEMSEAIVKMFDNPEKKWEKLNGSFAKIFSDVLLLPKEKFEEHAISPEIVTDMKRVLKTIIRSSSIIEREITKGFGKNRQLQNRFKALLK
ncbi:hypothetical protein TRFO_25286 [Tritrichomonas foetus]|uniref:Uncharacterized protein n=1 Tax=Tritrichomonas foetus TaxID=1144522 RepID=A0A1J4K6U3_9EUKA|nr:hypothetical protein TRFO_25286 [Tritrichomonas foetus]|eukprot:OHT06616.1 hypothetical protein TRFO_25286 [Tritrichomonas foetus]